MSMSIEQALAMVSAVALRQDIPLDDLALGVAILVGCGVPSWMAWTQRWTAWVGQPLTFTIPLHLLSGFAVIGLMIVVVSLFGDEAGGSSTLVFMVSLVGILVAFTLIGIALLGIFWRVPLGSLPEWLEDRYPFEPVVNDPLSAMLHVADHRIAKVAHLSRRTVEATYGERQRWLRWRVYFVEDPACAGPLRHHMAPGHGTVNGSLVGYDSGLGFWATFSEEVMRKEPLTVTVSANDLRAVWTVPHRADETGMRHPLSRKQRFERLQRRRRIVLEHGDGVALFEAHFSRRRADKLAELYEIERRPDR